MRWPFRRTDRRAAAPLATSGTWLRSAQPTPVPHLPWPVDDPWQHWPPEQSRRELVEESGGVVLGFRDGSSLVLPEASEPARALREVAAALVGKRLH